MKSFGSGSKNRYQNGTLLSGNMDQNLRNPPCSILSHTHFTFPSPFPLGQSVKFDLLILLLHPLQFFLRQAVAGRHLRRIIAREDRCARVGSRSWIAAQSFARTILWVPRICLHPGITPLGKLTKTTPNKQKQAGFI